MSGKRDDDLCIVAKFTSSWYAYVISESTCFNTCVKSSRLHYVECVIMYQHCQYDSNIRWSLGGPYWDFSKLFTASSFVLTQVSVSFSKPLLWWKKVGRREERRGAVKGRAISSRPLASKSEHFPSSHALPLSEWTNWVHVGWETLCLQKRVGKIFINQRGHWMPQVAFKWN